MKLTNSQAYEALTETNVHWDRIDSNTIVVWTQGYKTQDAYDIEKYLGQASFRAISQDFDSMCGKTKTTYKHK